MVGIASVRTKECACDSHGGEDRAYKYEPRSSIEIICRSRAAENRRLPILNYTQHQLIMDVIQYVVDVQGFRRSSNIFIAKELAIIPVQDNATPMVYNFQPPCPWSKLLAEEREVNTWLERNFHGIPWTSGTIPYTDLIRIMRSNLNNAWKIYVKGLEKANWLREILYEK